MSTTEFKGVLEIDADRGVIYFHVDTKEAAEAIGSVTLLRIGRLPTPIPTDRQLNIIHMIGVSWKHPDPVREERDELLQACLNAVESMEPGNDYASVLKEIREVLDKHGRLVSMQGYKPIERDEQPPEA